MFVTFGIGKRVVVRLDRIVTIEEVSSECTRMFLLGERSTVVTLTQPFNDVMALIEAAQKQRDSSW